MKKILLFLLLILTSTIGSLASTSDSISTTYSDGVFTSQYRCKVFASEKTIDEVSDKLVSDFQNSTTSLFDWALKDLGLQNEGNELIIIIKSSNHDVKTGITHGLFDIVVPYFKTFSNVKVDAIVSKTKNNHGVTKVSANIIYSSLLLKNGLAVLYIIPQKNNEMFFYSNVSIRFGWFFNIFITKKRYKSIVEWRIKKFTENMRLECIKTEKMASKK
ncbi:MAG: hypothetical protein GZ091_02110 [Paludibacter sp.]|nr:hypothetical protein [Paludibacter sp.]